MLASKALQVLAEGGFSEAIDRHGVTVPDDAVADLLENVCGDATASLYL